MSPITCPRLVIAAGLAAGLAACGKMGDLERPRPMFGRAETPRASAAPARQNPAEPVRTVDPREGLGPLPQRLDPIPNTQDPTRPSNPRGVLPDPFNRPQ